MEKGIIDLNFLASQIQNASNELGHITEDVQKQFSQETKQLAQHPEQILQLTSIGQISQSVQNLGKQIFQSLPKFELPKFDFPKFDLPKLNLPFKLPNLEQIKEYAIKYGIPIGAGIIGLIILVKLIPMLIAKRTVSKFIG